MRQLLNWYISLIFSQIFTKFSTLIHWDFEYPMPFGEPWASVHCGLESARATADRHPSSSWAAPLGRFSSGRLRLFVLVVPQRTKLTLLDMHPASNAPKVPYWAKLGDFWRGIIPFRGGQAGLLQKLGSVTRVMCKSRVCPAKVSTIRIFLANKRHKFSSETHVTVDASIHIRPTLKDNIFWKCPLARVRSTPFLHRKLFP